MTHTLIDNSKDVELSTFYIGDTICGIDILNIQEINKHLEFTSVPHSSDDIKGILNLRGKIVTIFDLGKRLGLNTARIGKNSKNIIVNSGDEHIGFLIDEICDVVKANRNDIEPAPSNMGGVKGKFFKGVLKTEEQLVGILDIDVVLEES
ncbi:MAG: chemotaxis protein CheW [Desulfobacterales bacterium]|nr:chemotaxis protein CheW [Desulfobacterales bacterium]MCP4163084.1 chemotaxis protein CheW [Deltaproteobacteria bacterium]